MTSRSYTIGMAGHIDHGKTALTKALTGIDTDRLKEERERQISIELGFAPFPLEGIAASIVDVPGHERFIRQMIAGVAGIDLVILVVAADEGVMPQTREHLEILRFLGVRAGVIAVTKADRAEPELADLVREEIRETVAGTAFEQAAMVFVDSLSGTGIPELKERIKDTLRGLPERNTAGAFRMPIDQVFTLPGLGTIVRGTIYEGQVHAGETLAVLPQGLKAKARELQIHRQSRESAWAGQRAAIQLGGVGADEIRRGDVIAAVTASYSPTRVADLSFISMRDLAFPLKQRAPVKFYAGTAEVMGKIVLFDRKETGANEEILCQVRLDEPVVLRRGDRFVLRRPSPVETIGGGWVIDPLGGRYRYGGETITLLRRKLEGTPADRVLEVLRERLSAEKHELGAAAALEEAELEAALTRLMAEDRIFALGGGGFASKEGYGVVRNTLRERLRSFHEEHPMRRGMNKAECLQAFSERSVRRLAEFAIERDSTEGELVKHGPLIALADHMPHFPAHWSRRMERAYARLEQAGYAPPPWRELLQEEGVPEPLHSEASLFLQEQGMAYELDGAHLIHRKLFETARHTLYNQTNGQAFGIQAAKQALEISRKNLVLLLDLLDREGFTLRTDEERIWLRAPLPHSGEGGETPHV